MPIVSTNRPGSDLSRSRLIVVLLALVSVLVLGLVWQSIQTARNNSATATLVLKDYARLVSDEFVRRAMAQVGYYGYNAELNTLSRQLAAGEGLKPSESDLMRMRLLISGGNVEATGALSPAARAHVVALAAAILGSAEANVGMTIDHTVINDGARTFVLTVWNEQVIGF
ncbi:MAG: hypothetical protein KJO82_02705, partial [Gammaproteobacteria bacterium]|nr:hypothetical protein [Gammaproteobacteria bacterium]